METQKPEPEVEAVTIYMTSKNYATLRYKAGMQNTTIETYLAQVVHKDISTTPPPQVIGATSATPNPIKPSLSPFHQPSLCLQFANKAFGRFWGNADPIQPDTHLSNAEIAKWIVKESNYQISTTMAEKIAQIIRPEWAHKGRKPNI